MIDWNALFRLCDNALRDAGYEKIEKVETHPSGLTVDSVHWKKKEPESGQAQ